MNLKKTAISGVKWTSVEKTGRAIFQLLQIAILTRFLPVEAFGLVALAFVVIGFTNIFVDMGLTSAILYKQNATQKEYSSIYWLNLFVSVILYSLLLFLTQIIGSFYEEPDLKSIIPILGANILLMALGRQHRTILQKEFKFKHIAFIELLSFFIALLVAVLLAVKNYGVYSLVYSTLTASVISNVLFLILNLSSNPIRLHFKFNDTIPFLRVGGYQMGSKVFDFISQEADIFIIGKMLGAEGLGVYSLAKQIVLKVYGLINPIVVNVLSPLLSAIQKEPKRLKETFLKVIKYLAYINFPIYLLIIVGSKEILYYLYGSDYTTGTYVLSFLAVFYCLSSISNPVGSLQIATGRTDIGFYWTILRIIITPVFIYSGALHSIDGVALAIAILSIILLIPMWYLQLKPMANIRFVEYFQQFYKPMILFALLGILFLIGGILFISEINSILLIIKQLSCLLVYFLLLLIIDRASIYEIYYFGFAIYKHDKVYK
jgi:O-antigen/teichoic acid export membrane protein